MHTIFVDGGAGTTGLRIVERLSARDDLRLVTLSEADRKDVGKRKAALNDCDAAFLCLPDQAAIEAVSLIGNEHVVVFDTSTAHRTNPDWAYGFPELSDQAREKILHSNRVAVPGCHASGAIALLFPLIEAGLLDPKTPIAIQSITGYSGGGKKMIAEYTRADRPAAFSAPRVYALGQSHKHLPEIVKVAELSTAPVFQPIVCDFYSGMLCSIPIERTMVAGDIDAIKAVYRRKYAGPIVRFVEELGEGGFIAANALSGKDTMQIAVMGNDERFVLYALFDNLGKGASGAAIQCMNYRLGLAQCAGLNI